MRFKIKAWLKAKLGFRRSSIPYEEFQDERVSTPEEIKMEPMIYKSGGGVLFIRILKMLFGRRIYPTYYCSHALVISASICITCHVCGCLDYKFNHISHCLDTTKCTYSAALQCLFGL
ncbi:hypothetical protein TNIN_198881 [Trichonephila inaurata madagascariensis]|uniref:Uncharacterized protein n=1 Tax=Trichonephila inaurata madagascariensis TaxID=2747483 RepID=A0A8X6WNQ3_9ARAC|nr:hypothetical protein TNIN_198881 [Trichonephila inaurata madagascariensis]